MVSRLFHWLWGDLSCDELKRYGLLSLTFLFIIGSYWLLRPLKDSIFVKIVGIDYQPKAKYLSVSILIPLIFIYSKLVDLCKKHTLFYVIGSTYMVVFAIIAYFLGDPKIGLANTVVSPYRTFGWFVYVMIESFGSMMVSLFWSFVTSTTSHVSAKRGFPLIISGAQIGSILGPTFVAFFARRLGVSGVTFMSIMSISMIMVMIYLFMTLFPHDSLVADEKKEREVQTGMIEGLRLIFSRPYILGIFGVTTLYEIIGTVIEYQMKVLAVTRYTTAESYAEFMAYFGQATNGLALICALLGTSYFLRRFGLLFCLVFFPVLVGSIVSVLFFVPKLWVVFWGMVAIKGLSYGLNNPTKETMYIPTSHDVRFKAKGWIDMFGNRSAKAAGSIVNDFLKAMSHFMMYGTVLSLGIIGIWIPIAFGLGKKFHKLVEEKKIIQ